MYMNSHLAPTEFLPLSTCLEHNFPNSNAFWDSGEGKRALSFHQICVNSILSFQPQELLEKNMLSSPSGLGCYNSGITKHRQQVKWLSLCSGHEGEKGIGLEFHVMCPDPTSGGMPLFSQQPRLQPWPNCTLGSKLPPQLTAGNFIQNQQVWSVHLKVVFGNRVIQSSFRHILTMQ